MAVEITLLGEVGARIDGQAADLGPARQRCVLAALAMDVNRAVSVEQLIERVWGASPPLRSRTTLAAYASRLRKVFGDAVMLAYRSNGYVLVADESIVDLMRFRAARAEARSSAGDDERVAQVLDEALRWWPGEALTGIGGEWAEQVRDRLRLERHAAESDLVDARLRLGQGRELVASLSALAADRPLDERVAGQYMLALHQAGRVADALDQFRVVRARLVEELGTEPGAELQRVHERLLHTDSAPVSDTVPRQLPTAPPQFVGRGEALTRLDDALRTSVVATVAGAGGMGKTWLALHWAHRNLVRFPDGQLFVDLRGFSPDETPMDPDVAIRGFLHALGVEPAQVPAEPHARATLFRSLTVDRRMLLLIDNAADASQVVPMLPGGGTCRVVVTSRNTLLGLVTAHGARPVGLDVLGSPDAAALLGQRIGAARLRDEPAAVAELIALCGGLPLALSVVSARVLTEPHLSLAAVALQLRELGLGALDGDPAVSLPTVLSWSYRSLTAAQKEMFGLLGIAPGEDVSLAACASLAGVPIAVARSTLRELEQASLVTLSPSLRVRMHDLVRAYASAQAPADADDALLRLVDHLIHTAHANDQVIDPLRPVHALPPAVFGALVTPAHGKESAMAWFDAERTVLRATQLAAAERGWGGLVVRLARVSHLYHQRRGYLDDELAMWQTALDHADALEDRLVACRIMGTTFGQVQRFDDSLRLLQQALALAADIGTAEHLANVHAALSWLWSYRNDLERSFEHSVASLHHYQQGDNQMLIAQALNAVGYSAGELGDFDTARSHCTEALALCRSLGDQTGVAEALDSLGHIEHRCGNHAESVGFYRESVALLRELDHAISLAVTLGNLGHPYVALGQYDLALAAWQEARALFEQQGRQEDADRMNKQIDTVPSA